MEGDAVGAQLHVQPVSHFGVEGCHHLGQRFHHRHVEPAVMQLLGHFESDIATANHDGTTTLATFRPLHDFSHVGNVSHDEMIWALNARDGWLQGGCPRGKN